jgi:asparagine synthase (glutamine-hydrolysing)
MSLSMCGIVGVVRAFGERPRVSEAQFVGMRDQLQSRGPDAGEHLFHRNVAFGHRRLAVIALGADGAQPMVTADGRWSITYNGELYNDAELRASLKAGGHEAPISGSDTATLLAVLQAWGIDGLTRLRGMYALAAHDRHLRAVHLARDPLGMKPLYWSFDGIELVFASDPKAILAHPEVSAVPDLEGISAYLSNLRSCLGERTLFGGISCLAPGQRLELQTDGSRFRPHVIMDATPSVATTGDCSAEEAGEQLRELMEDSVRRHLWSDRPVALLLSGGIDSALISALAQKIGCEAKAYVAGSDREGAGGDLDEAAAVAKDLGLELERVVLSEGDFVHGWQQMVRGGGMPLSTPNEVAIHRLAQRIADDGAVVALGGEGADEVFGGSGAVMDAAHAFEEVGVPGLGAGRFHLEACAWIAPVAKVGVFTPEVWGALNGDEGLVNTCDRLFEAGVREAGPDADPLEAHLRFLRRVNLTGLLERLDRSTMLASVEGRTPFADTAIRKFADGLCMSAKFTPRAILAGAGGGAASRGEEIGPPRTKLAVREAARGLVSEHVLQRPKTSFPLPLQDWIGQCGPLLTQSPFARALFQDSIIEQVAAAPGENWTYAWPMLNIAMWGDRWF